ncbi:hypothetical protein CABS01_08766 [Colletotrichum abscissum]|uniref:uncharacterized protein n=1 Tax=Colletotrichum abscissum TaxID=1671311 RepID=UPI0027D61B0F|nr:uncharacterized protein CABS01_08766 [Colletotrichum abscissum]KAK1504988.1 hypothetical protein CABS01_08766 [Colletotrichum abscissum]
MRWAAPHFLHSRYQAFPSFPPAPTSHEPWHATLNSKCKCQEGLKQAGPWAGRKLATAGPRRFRWHGWWKESSTRRPDLPPRALSIGSRTTSMSHPICLDGRGGGCWSCTAAAVPRLSHPPLAVPSRSLVCALTRTGHGPWWALGLDSMAFLGVSFMVKSGKVSSGMRR